MNKSIYELKLHEVVRSPNGQNIERVPGGWNYIYDYAVQFVPYNKEFLPKNETSPKKEAVKKAVPNSMYDVYFQFMLNGLLPEDAWKKANDFMNFYSANGWKVGKNPMKDWKSAVNGTWTKEYTTLFAFQKKAMEKIVEAFKERLQSTGSVIPEDISFIKKTRPALFNVTELPQNWADKYGEI